MTKFSTIAGALLFSALLTGCSGAELLIGLPVFGLYTMGDKMSQSMANGLGCALGVGMSVFGRRVPVTLENQEYLAITNEIRTKRIGDVNGFWTQLDPAESARLRELVRQGYEPLAEGTDLRRRPVEFYADLLAQGLIGTARENVTARSMTFGRYVRVSDRPTRYESYLLTLTIEGSSSDQVKNYTTCE